MGIHADGFVNMVQKDSFPPMQSNGNTIDTNQFLEETISKMALHELPLTGYEIINSRLKNSHRDNSEYIKETKKYRDQLHKLVFKSYGFPGAIRTEPPTLGIEDETGLTILDPSGINRSFLVFYRGGDLNHERLQIGEFKIDKDDSSGIKMISSHMLLHEINPSYENRGFSQEEAVEIIQKRIAWTAWSFIQQYFNMLKNNHNDCKIFFNNGFVSLSGINSAIDRNKDNQGKYNNLIEKIDHIFDNKQKH